MAAIGYGCNKDDVMTKANELIEANNLQHLFKDGRVHDKWYDLSLKRHP